MNKDKYPASTDFHYKKGNDLVSCFATNQKAYRVNDKQIVVVDSNNKLIGFVEYNPTIEERFEMVKEIGLKEKIELPPPNDTATFTKGG